MTEGDSSPQRRRKARGEAELRRVPKGRRTDTVPDALDEWSEAVDVVKADDLTREGKANTVNRIAGAREDYNEARQRQLHRPTE